MKKLLIWSRVPYFNHCSCHFCYHRAKKYHPKRLPLPTLYLRQNLIYPPASRLYLKELLNIFQTVSSCSRHITFFLFGSRFHRQYLPIPNALAQIYALTLVLMRTSRKTHYSQSINNFSDYDMSQTHDWECPSLSPHVLLIVLMTSNQTRSAPFFDFEMMRMISEQIALQSVQLPLFI